MGKTFKTDYGGNCWKATIQTAKCKSRTNRTLRNRLHKQANNEIHEYFSSDSSQNFNKLRKYTYIDMEYYYKTPAWTKPFKHNGTKSWDKLHDTNNCVSNFSCSCFENNENQYSCLHHLSKITEGGHQSCVESEYSKYVKKICDKQMKRRNETGKKYLFDRIKRQKNGVYDKDVYNPKDNIHY